VPRQIMNRFVATAHAAAALLQRIPLETREARRH